MFIFILNWIFNIIIVITIIYDNKFLDNKDHIFILSYSLNFKKVILLNTRCNEKNR